MSGPQEAQLRPVPRWAAPFVGVGGAIVGGLYVIFMPVIFGGLAIYYAGVGVKRLATAGSRKLAASSDESATPPAPPQPRR